MTVEAEDDVIAPPCIGRIGSGALQQMLDAAGPGMTTRELDARATFVELRPDPSLGQSPPRG